MSGSSVTLALERIASKDKDFRYMGTSDLLNELNRDTFRIDPDSEKRLCHVVLQQLDDASGDISGLAVKCLVPLVKKASEARVAEMSAALVGKLLTGKDPQRDIASIALKTVVAEVASPAAIHHLLSSLPAKLTAAIDSPDTSVDVKGECLDVLGDVLQRFGVVMAGDHERLLVPLLHQLSSPRASLRKRATQCLASLAASLSDDLLARATNSVVALLQRKDLKPEMTRSYIQMVGALCRAVGYRFGPHLGVVLPLVVGFCENASENDDEIREYSLQALESFVVRCPKDVSAHCEAILDLALKYLSYDPNFTDDAMEGDEEGEGGEEEEEEEDDDEEYSDDEDVSWKVRRAAARCIASITTSRPELLATLYAKASPKLIERFREREENVKVDVFNAFIDLLRQTGHATKGHATPADVPPGSPLFVLREETPRIVKSLNRQLKEKSLKTRVGVFCVLKELVHVLPNCLTDLIALLIPGIQKALTDKASNSNLKIEALLFTRLAMASHPPQVFQPHIKALAAPVVAAAGERYYKVTAEALRVLGEMVKAIRPPAGEGSGFDFAPYVPLFYEAIMKRLTAQDQDLEVKECAIGCMGLLVSILGDHLQSQLSTCLPLLLDRLRNEITRLTAVKAFGTIAESPLHINLSSVLEPTLAELTSFLRKANRSLRQASLCTLNAILSAYGADITDSARDALLTELAPLISDSDLALAALALQLCCSVTKQAPPASAAAAAVAAKVLPQALALVRSPLLQGQALQTLQEFFAVQVQASATSFDSLLSALLSAGRPFSSSMSPAAAAAAASSSAAARPAFSSVAQCAAVLCVAAGSDQCGATVRALMGNVESAGHPAADTHKQLLSLLCLGEIGRRVDLSAHPTLPALVMSAFSSPLEEVKTAASFALGSIAVGNHSQYLPFVLQQIDSQPKLQYLLLHSLKEIISGRASSAGSQAVELEEGNVAKVLALLFTHSESDEEGVRNVVAECLGRLALIDPARLVPALKERVGSPSAFTRATVVAALKFTLTDAPQPIDAYLKQDLASFLFLLRDDDRHVRRAAVLALTTAAHNKPGLVEDLLPDLLPLLYDQMRVKPEMIRTVDLGPFKHTVDDGLELRKAAFDCMDTLLSTCLHRIQPAAFITPFLISGLSDNYDVKMPCHLVLAKLAEKCGPSVLAVIDALVEPLEKTVTARVKTDAVKQEVDRNEDMVRSALRAVDALSRISNVESSNRFKTFMNNVVKAGPVGQLYSQIRSEQDAVAGSSRAEL
ncbi:hypothetical protein CLOM_g18863 [Closterium sp. NIES-68]|nr:hypothetical protein CLOM_g18863 [Closterium sp. NIES-68]GJP76760.1 hypothetical protein CLOP_g7223 [Closterium sp. NIES-67]